MGLESIQNQSPAHSCTPAVKFCVIWEGLSLQRATKFCSYMNIIVDSRAFSSWSLIPGEADLIW